MYALFVGANQSLLVFRNVTSRCRWAGHVPLHTEPPVRRGVWVSLSVKVIWSRAEAVRPFNPQLGRTDWFFWPVLTDQRCFKKFSSQITSDLSCFGRCVSAYFIKGFNPERVKINTTKKLRSLIRPGPLHFEGFNLSGITTRVCVALRISPRLLQRDIAGTITRAHKGVLWRSAHVNKWLYDPIRRRLWSRVIKRRTCLRASNDQRRDTTSHALFSSRRYTTPRRWVCFIAYLREV